MPMIVTQGAKEQKLPFLNHAKLLATILVARKIFCLSGFHN